MLPTPLIPDVKLSATASITTQPVTRVGHVPADLPDIRAGQSFNVKIQATLDSGIYRAQVDGKTITINLPPGYKVGDSITLTALTRTAERITARLADIQSETAASSNIQVSVTGQMIAKLLPNAGQAPLTTRLNAGAPLLPSPITTVDAEPVNTHILANTLAQSVAVSGLFYEAHQAEWVQGKRTTAALLKEPQNTLQESPLPAVAAHMDMAANTSLASTDLLNLSEPLKQLVQNQLETASNERLLLQLSPWPDADMHWEIDPEKQRSDNSAEAEASVTWATRLALTTPQLGRIEATLQLTPLGLRLSLNADDADKVSLLKAEQLALGNALAAAGLNMIAMDIRKNTPLP